MFLRKRSSLIEEVYRKLLKFYGFQNWWPVHKGTDSFLEISVGAILTQNTSWKNVEKALDNLIKENLLNWKNLSEVEEKRLRELIRPAGFFIRKAKTIKEFVGTIKDFPKEKITREILLSIKGIGPETADSILLYGLNRPFFVIDAYTKRLFFRLGIIEDENISYEKLQKVITNSIEKNVEVYKQYHALIVEHSKVHCKKKPVCINCPLEDICIKMV